MSGVTDHREINKSYSGTLLISGKLTSVDNKICAAAGSLVIESNTVGTQHIYEGKITYNADTLTDYFHISNLLGFQILGANIKITSLEIYTGDITAPDKIDSFSLKHVKISDGVVSSDWTDPDDKSPDAGTISYPDVDITLAEDCVYFLEVVLDGGTTNFDILGFGIIYDMV